jgi:hypothetical protein
MTEARLRELIEMKTKIDNARSHALDARALIQEYDNEDIPIEYRFPYKMVLINEMGDSVFEFEYCDPGDILKDELKLSEEIIKARKKQFKEA